MSFLETPRFPTNLSYGSAGGPSYSTTVVITSGGHEKRNSNWTYPLQTFDAAFSVAIQEDLYELIEYFHVANGKAHGFRFKDHSDYKSCSPLDTVSASDQVIGVGDGATSSFQLIKTYTKGALSQVRQIKKPVSGTVIVELGDGASPEVFTTQVLDTDYTLDTTTGIITFLSSPAPTGTIRAGYEFDVPVRFNTDSLSTSLEDYQAGSAQVPIVETRL